MKWSISYWFYLIINILCFCVVDCRSIGERQVWCLADIFVILSEYESTRYLSQSWWRIIHTSCACSISVYIYIYIYTPSSLWYKTHLSGQLNCWSLRCSWSIACRRCSNYILIIDLIPVFNGLSRDNGKTRQESFKFWDLVRLILEILRYHILPIISISHHRPLLLNSSVVNVICQYVCDLE